MTITDRLPLPEPSTDYDRPDGPHRATPSALSLLAPSSSAPADVLAAARRVMSAALAWMAANEGTREDPPRTNRVWIWGKVKPEWNGQPWCGATITAAYLAQGIDLRPLVGNPYYVPQLEAWAKTGPGWWRTDSARSGDLTIFGGSTAEHVGMAWPDPDTSTYRSREGNTSYPDGRESYGGVLTVRYRSRSWIRGWVDMAAVLTWMHTTGRVNLFTLAPNQPPTTPPEGPPMALTPAEERAQLNRIMGGIPAGSAEDRTGPDGKPARVLDSADGDYLRVLLERIDTNVTLLLTGKAQTNA